MRQRTFRVLAAGGLALAGFAAATAFSRPSPQAVTGRPPHVHLEKSQPGANDTLTTPPKSITLWFSEAPELAVTTVQMAGTDKKHLSMDAPKRGTKAMGPGGDAAIVVGIKEAPKPGTYKVTWKTMSDDGHPADGSFTFVVAKGAKDRTIK
jgi:methionine-rich copper-binding protein CopC